ncbi:MAG: TrkA family potassium uptake protein [Chloroflexi bacterium]|jgi:trk system potassium uptake protein TrkA|nr:TrkA family potassium uptake protein [Dehalococcoidia bacterium]MCO5201752.1 TrkA family potassium uptake protein [Chloroflexota bacterium]MCZ7578542.1 TrkA family potassium uptake protein [Dehalococcoidia bacterium]NJD65749.1 TrkA family potassium uptake protein [Chloroflexota bacterium]PWB45060.1 MAG: portal protein [Dehalococcoidia bacterium]
MYILIAGGGKVGYHLAEELLNENNEVLVIERDAGRAAQIRDELSGNVLTGDSCEATTLDLAGVSRADLVAAVTGDDEDNLVICDIARYRGVGRTIARINNPRNELLFRKRGIETTISATQAVLAQIEKELPTQLMIPLLQLHNGLELVEIKLPETSPVAGRSVREVLLPAESLISLIVDPGGVPRMPSGDTRLNAGDALVVVSRKESLDMLREQLIGSTHGLDT